MNKLLALIALIGFFIAPSLQQGHFPGLAFIRDELTGFTYGAGRDGVVFEFPVGRPEKAEIEFELLSERDAEEWTLELVTGNGDLYVVTNDEGHLMVYGPNEFELDATHAYAEKAEIEDWQAVDDFGDWIFDQVDDIYDLYDLNQVD